MSSSTRQIISSGLVMSHQHYSEDNTSDDALTTCSNLLQPTQPSSFYLQPSPAAIIPDVLLSNNDGIPTASDDEIIQRLCGSKKCPYCPYENNCMRFLLAHIRNHSSGSKVYPCQLCPYVGKKMSHIKAHIRKHTGEKPFQCHLCGKQFSMHHTLHYHFNTHKDNPQQEFSCVYCYKRF